MKSIDNKEENKSDATDNYYAKSESTQLNKYYLKSPISSQNIRSETSPSVNKSG